MLKTHQVRPSLMAALLIVFSFPTITHLYAPAPIAAQEPEVFAPGVVSTEAIEYGITFSLDGTEAYFTRRASFRDTPHVYCTRFENGQWTQPAMVSFSAEGGAEYPFLSRDGARLYFASKRAPDGTGDEQGSNDMWVVTKNQDGWGEPRHLGGVLGTPDVESAPVEAPDGSLYFHSRRQDGAGAVDIYRAPSTGDGYGAPALVSISSAGTDGEVSFSADGSVVVFYSDRDGGWGGGDLYWARRDGDTYGQSMNLGPAVNTAVYEWTPYLSHDDGRLYFSRLNSDFSRADIMFLPTVGLFE